MCAISYRIIMYAGMESIFMFAKSFDGTGYSRLEIKNINKDILLWLEDIIDENNCRIERKEWKSKYNSYVVYDYEPFCTDGFEINLTVISHNSAYLNFIKYLYDEKLSTIEYLNSCIDV